MGFDERCVRLLESRQILRSLLTSLIKPLVDRLVLFDFLRPLQCGRLERLVSLPQLADRLL